MPLYRYSRTDKVSNVKTKLGHISNFWVSNKRLCISHKQCHSSGTAPNVELVQRVCHGDNSLVAPRASLSPHLFISSSDEHWALSNATWVFKVIWSQAGSCMESGCWDAWLPYPTFAFTDIGSCIVIPDTTYAFGYGPVSPNSFLPSLGSLSFLAEFVVVPYVGIQNELSNLSPIPTNRQTCSSTDSSWFSCLEILIKIGD